ncbi:hypothetical protein LTR94_030380, partial [Friedmanniomyces endolithicus]
MISAHPHVKGSTNDALIRAVEAAYACAATCRICADACLGEAMVADLVQCIRLNLDCADVCAAAGAVGAIAAGMTAALKLGWLDRFFTVMDADPGAEHAAPDLAPAAATPGTARAPEAFRPDPTAAVPASEREALRPATGPVPSMVAPRGSMA